MSGAANLNKIQLGCRDCVNDWRSTDCPVVRAHAAATDEDAKAMLCLVDSSGSCEMYSDESEQKCDCPTPRPDLKEPQFSPRDLIDAYMRQFDTGFLEAAERVEWVGAWLYREMEDG